MFQKRRMARMVTRREEMAVVKEELLVSSENKMIRVEARNKLAFLHSLKLNLQRILSHASPSQCVSGLQLNVVLLSLLQIGAQVHGMSPLVVSIVITLLDSNTVTILWQEVVSKLVSVAELVFQDLVVGSHGPGEFRSIQRELWWSRAA